MMDIIKQDDYTIFVYGTLKSGSKSPMHALLKDNSMFLGRATLNAKLYDAGGYPGAVLSSEPNDIVLGEAYLLHKPEILLKELDAYEEYGPGFSEPFEFKRIKAKITLETGIEVDAWVYVYNLDVDKLKPIKGYDYLKS